MTDYIAYTGLYPLVSCLIHLSTTVLILYLISHPELTKLVRLLLTPT
jgi:hypothetical protein